MYKLLEKLFVSVLFVCILISCRKQTESDILSGQAFEDVLLRAEKEQKYLCLVLIDSGQHNAMDLLKNQLNGEFKSLKRKVIFNAVDIYADGNRWYEKWLCPISVPLTCVFSPDGTLLNLLPDLTYESFAYMKKTVEKPVKISTVETSCSCVSFLGREIQYTILPHDSVQMPFEFYAEQKGEIERGCYFVSDARNPVVDVKILATVRSEQAIDGK